ncbi:MAG: Spy/CpxP family protein refolding chaperone [Desulfatiglans sp.]|jgi:Spy/CpxP family protein refolding chaperone|nr:Spy/CpxP family protein refolding chaperone [Thermodesulfobacteriota bacterium]MEE4351381.1 Spy/CpxP family protein refolding chaperone [Desulfatiglans sp.]
MNSKPTQTVVAGIFVLLVTVCLIPAVAGASGLGGGKPDHCFAMKGHHRPLLGIWRSPQMIEKLGLTTEQINELREADFAFREKRLALKAEIDSLRLQMDKAFSEDKADNEAVLSLAKKMADLKGKKYLQRVESRLALQRLLTPDQVKKLNLYDRRQKMMGQRRCDKRFDGPQKKGRPDYKMP